MILVIEDHEEASDCLVSRWEIATENDAQCFDSLASGRVDSGHTVAGLYLVDLARFAADGNEAVDKESTVLYITNEASKGVSSSPFSVINLCRERPASADDERGLPGLDHLAQFLTRLRREVNDATVIPVELGTDRGRAMVWPVVAERNGVGVIVYPSADLVFDLVLVLPNVGCALEFGIY